MVIDAELNRDDHDSIHRNCDRKGTKTTLCQNWPSNQIKLVVKTKNTYNTSKNVLEVGTLAHRVGVTQAYITLED
jgi:hypothetical protein